MYFFAGCPIQPTTQGLLTNLVLAFVIQSQSAAREEKILVRKARVQFRKTGKLSIRKKLRIEWNKHQTQWIKHELTLHCVEWPNSQFCSLGADWWLYCQPTPEKDEPVSLAMICRPWTRGCLRSAVLIQPQLQAENPCLQMSCGTRAALPASRAVLKCNSPKRNCANSHTSRAKSQAPAKWQTLFKNVFAEGLVGERVTWQNSEHKACCAAA